MYTIPPPVYFFCIGSSFQAKKWITLADHPRLRGENAPPLVLPDGLPGSPPLTRGKHINGHMPALLSRITPAYAGKTLKQSFQSVFLFDPVESFTQFTCSIKGVRQSPHSYGKRLLLTQREGRGLIGCHALAGRVLPTASRPFTTFSSISAILMTETLCSFVKKVRRLSPPSVSSIVRTSEVAGIWMVYCLPI